MPSRTDFSPPTSRRSRQTAFSLPPTGRRSRQTAFTLSPTSRRTRRFAFFLSAILFSWALIILPPGIRAEDSPAPAAVTPSGAADPAIAAQAVADSAAVQAPAGPVKELKVWIIWRDHGNDAAYRKFEQEYPGWKIVTSFTTPLTIGPGAQQKLLTAIAGGDPPDLIMFDRFSVGEWVVRGALASEQEWVDASGRLEDAADAVLHAVAEGDSKDALEPLGRIREAMKSFPGCAIVDLADRVESSIRSDSPRDTILPVARELRVHCDGIRQEEFYTACWEEGSYGQGEDREIFTVPMTTDSRALFYNEDLFERAGLVDENGKAKPPRDWDELKEYAVKLTEFDKGGAITQLGFAPNYGNSWLYLYGWLNGGQFMSEDGMTCTLADPRIVEACQYMVDVYDACGGIEKVDVFQSRPMTAGYDLFILGKVAMVINCDIGMRFIADLEPNLRFGVTAPPPPKGKSPATWSGGFSWAIPKGARHADTAFELIRFINTERMWKLQADVNARFSASRGRTFLPMMAPIPAINEMFNRDLIANNPDVPPRVRQYFPLFSEIMKISRYRPATPVGMLLWDEQVRAFDKSVRHTYTPREACERGQKSVQTALDRIYQDRGHPRVNWTTVVVCAAALLAILAALTYALGGRRELLRRLSKPESRAGYLFALPWIAAFVTLTAGPIGASLVYSFCNYDILNPAEWVGLTNYTRLVHDPLFWKSLLNTLYMMVGVPLGMAVGLGIAMLLNLSVRGMKTYRTIFYLPAIVPMVASAILWIWVLSPQNGLLNSLLRMVGVAQPPLWLQSSSWGLGSKAAIILMGIWAAGGGMIIWLAGLKGIPAHLYEAAEIDGAGPVGRFLNVTLPMLSPYIFFNLVMGIISTMQIFSQAFIMTAGGPDDSTLFYAFYLFNNAFVYLKMGYASAMAWILMVIVCALTVAQLVLSKRWVYYEGD